MTKVTTSLMNKDFFSTLPFWGALERTEQQTVERETKALAEAHAGQVALRTQMGQHLLNLQAVLEPRRQFRPYLNSLHISYRTAYRWMQATKAAKELIPEHVLMAAAARGFDLVGYSAKDPLGPYSESVRRLPPPKNPDKVPAWLEQIEESRKATGHKARGAHSGRRDVAPERRLRAAFRSVDNQWKKMPNGKARTQWGLKLIGVLMGEFGIPAQRIEPEAVPDGFRAVVGRPRIRAVPAVA